jgi:hypothetical protein
MDIRHQERSNGKSGVLLYLYFCLLRHCSLCQLGQRPFVGDVAASFKQQVCKLRYPVSYRVTIGDAHLTQGCPNTIEVIVQCLDNQYI